MAGADEVRAGGAFIDLFTKDDKLRKGLKGARQRLASFSKGVLTAGAKVAGLAGIMAAPFVKAIPAQAEFSKGMAFISTMLDRADMGFLPQMEAGIKSLALETGEATATMQRGLFDILSAGIDASKSMEVLEVAVKAANAGITTTAVSADAITTILNSYQLSASRAGDVSDLLFSIVKRGKTTFEELGPSIGIVAATASVSGLSLEDLGASLATMTRNGINTRIAVTSLNAILSTFLKPTEAAKEAAKKFGFELNTEILRTEGLIGVLKRMQGARAEDIAAVFENVRALRGVAAILQDVTGFQKDLNIMTDRAGRTAEAYKKQMSSLDAQIKRLKASMGLLFLELGKSVEPLVREWIPAIRNYLSMAIDWIKANRDLVVMFLKVAAVIGIIGGALLGLGAIIGVVSFALGGLAILFSPVALIILGVVAAVAALTLAFGSLMKTFDQSGPVESSTARMRAASNMAKRFEKQNRELAKSQQRVLDIQKQTEEQIARINKRGELRARLTAGELTKEEAKAGLRGGILTPADIRAAPGFEEPGIRAARAEEATEAEKVIADARKEDLKRRLKAERLGLTEAELVTQELEKQIKLEQEEEKKEKIKTALKRKLLGITPEQELRERLQKELDDEKRKKKEAALKRQLRIEASGLTAEKFAEKELRDASAEEKRKETEEKQKAELRRQLGITTKADRDRVTAELKSAQSNLKQGAQATQARRQTLTGQGRGVIGGFAGGIVARRGFRNQRVQDQQLKTLEDSEKHLAQIVKNTSARQGTLR